MGSRRTIQMQTPGDTVTETRSTDAAGRTVTQYSATGPPLSDEEKAVQASRDLGTLVFGKAMLGSSITPEELDVMVKTMPRREGGTLK